MFLRTGSKAALSAISSLPLQQGRLVTGHAKVPFRCDLISAPF